MSPNRSLGRPSDTALSHQATADLRVIRPIADEITTFPSTRYYGSKRKLLNWIYSSLKGIEFDTALDAFGGTASVSLLFKAMRKEVAYHDGFKFNGDVARTLLSGSPALTRQEVEEFCAEVSPRQGVIANNFAGIYYLDDENCWLDGFMEKLASDRVSPEAGALLRYLLYQSCLKKRPFNLFHRANLAIRTRPKVSRSFGNAVTWEKAFSEHILKAYDELSASMSLTPTARTQAVILPHGDVANLCAGYDLVYLDPPYINRNSSRNRDHYWKRYHFLEGLANYDSWEQNIDHRCPLKSLPQPAWFSPWTYKESFAENLFALIRRFRDSTVVLSYVTDAYPTYEEIKREFDTVFREVSIHSMEHSHALSGTRKRELLFVGRPR